MLDLLRRVDKVRIGKMGVPAVVRCRRWRSSLPTGQRLDARDLIVVIGDLPVDGDRRQVTPDPARGGPPLQVALGVETRDLARVGVRFRSSIYLDPREGSVVALTPPSTD